MPEPSSILATQSSCNAATVGMVDRDRFTTVARSRRLVYDTARYLTSETFHQPFVRRGVCAKMATTDFFSEFCDGESARMPTEYRRALLYGYAPGEQSLALHK